MKRSRELAFVFFSICVGALPVIVRARGQATVSGAVPMAEQTFKNVQILRGIPVDEFMDTMGMFTAATGLNCAHCHAIDNGAGWEAYATETPLKQTARRMLRMMNAINKDNFGGARVITCNTCHHGDQRPKPVPSLTIQYSAPTEDPNDVDAFPATGMPRRIRSSISTFRPSAAARASIR